MAFQSADPQLFFSRQDKTDPRLGDLVKVLPPSLSAESLGDTVKEFVSADQSRHFVLGGYPDDEGVRLNGGRLGAGQAPTEIRRSLYKLTPSAYGANNFTLWDAGDLKVSGVALEQKHEQASSAALAVLRAGARWIGLGGGHDYGISEGLAFVTWAKEQSVKPLVLNFDAHLDVRPTTNGLSSGTPFFRLLESGHEIDFAEIGIQGHCNSRSHLDWLKSRGGRVLTQEEVEASGEPLVTHVTRILGDWILKPRPVFLSIDIDGFSSAVAPGCSQSWATGFMPHDFFPVLNLLCARLDVRALGIYEVSPSLDQDARTSKLAAQIVHRVITT